MSLPVRIGIGGPVGSGKTALAVSLCKKLYPKYDLAVITNDIYTREDAEFVTKAGVQRESVWVYFIDKDGDISRAKMARGRK